MASPPTDLNQELFLPSISRRVLPPFPPKIRCFVVYTYPRIPSLQPHQDRRRPACSHGRLGLARSYAVHHQGVALGRMSSTKTTARMHTPENMLKATFSGTLWSRKAPKAWSAKPPQQMPTMFMMP